jgi:hypothetical protein
MSYFLTAYVVDLADVKAVMGSKNASVMKAVEAMIQERYDDEEDDEVQEDHTAALQQLIMGEPGDPGDPSAYGWVFQYICRARGEELLPDAWGGVRWDAVGVCGLEPLLTKTGASVPLPAWKGELPSIGHIKRSDLNSYLQAAAELKKKHKEEGINNLLDEYIGWLEEAAAKKKDIVLVYG